MKSNFRLRQLNETPQGFPPKSAKVPTAATVNFRILKICRASKQSVNPNNFGWAILNRKIICVV